MQHLKEKYGLWTAIAMVVGIVIGSGVFFKADDVLTLTEGNLILGLVAWVLGAIAMIFGALVFAEFAQRIKKENGIVDYAEVAYGERIGYLVGWFKGNLYYTPLVAILSWVSALYTLVLFGSSNPDNSAATWILALVYMIGAYLLNYFAPMIGASFQVTATGVKLVPLFAIGLAGIFSGLSSGVTVENFTAAASAVGSQSGTLASAVVATAFAYEGWICATAINSEIRDSERNLPRALAIGTLLILFVYVLYFVGIASVLPTATILSEGDNAVNMAANGLFGQFGATILIAFVVISCLGTLNGLVIGSIRVPYSLAIRGHGPMPGLLSRVNKETDIPTASTLYEAILSAVYIAIWYGSLNGFFGRYIGLDEIPIVMVYGIYLLLYVWYMKEFTDLSFARRWVIPILASVGALIILYGGATNPSVGIYLLISLGVILLGLAFYRKQNRTEEH